MGRACARRRSLRAEPDLNGVGRDRRPHPTLDATDLGAALDPVEAARRLQLVEVDGHGERPCTSVVDRGERALRRVHENATALGMCGSQKPDLAARPVLVERDRKYAPARQIRSELDGGERGAQRRSKSASLERVRHVLSPQDRRWASAPFVRHADDSPSSAISAPTTDRHRGPPHGPELDEACNNCAPSLSAKTSCVSSPGTRSSRSNNSDTGLDAGDRARMKASTSSPMAWSCRVVAAAISDESCSSFAPSERKMARTGTSSAKKSGKVTPRTSTRDPGAQAYRSARSFLPRALRRASRVMRAASDEPQRPAAAVAAPLGALRVPAMLGAARTAR